MRVVIFALIMAACLCSELAVTKEYTEYLKKTASWEVMNYEENIFRGWTTDEVQGLLGLKPELMETNLPEHIPTGPIPSSLNWKSTCDHGPQNQANCGSCWAFGTVGMLSSRCCLHTEDKGWLSPQELVSCDRRNNGCNGGSPHLALLYFMENKGAVPDPCFPYKAAKTPCPNKCVDGSPFKEQHVCECHGITECKTIMSMKSCLQTGPITVGFAVCQSFLTYKSGIYKCDCDKYLGYHAVLLMGYSDHPECHWIIRNSWGASWGEQGYFKMACNTCKVDGHLGGANVMCNKVG